MYADIVIKVDILPPHIRQVDPIFTFKLFRTTDVPVYRTVRNIKLPSYFVTECFLLFFNFQLKRTIQEK